MKKNIESFQILKIEREIMHMVYGGQSNTQKAIPLSSSQFISNVAYVRLR